MSIENTQPTPFQRAIVGGLVILAEATTELAHATRGETGPWAFGDEVRMNADRAIAEFFTEPESAPIDDRVTMSDVMQLLRDGVETDGDHHKQWFLEMIARKLGVDLPEHDRGIVP